MVRHHYTSLVVMSPQTRERFNIRTIRKLIKIISKTRKDSMKERFNPISRFSGSQFSTSNTTTRDIVHYTSLVVMSPQTREGKRERFDICTMKKLINY